jgi:hypothetical protein
MPIVPKNSTNEIGLSALAWRKIIGSWHNCVYKGVTGFSKSSSYGIFKELSEGGGFSILTATLKNIFFTIVNIWLRDSHLFHSSVLKWLDCIKRKKVPVE